MAKALVELTLTFPVDEDLLVHHGERVLHRTEGGGCLSELVWAASKHAEDLGDYGGCMCSHASARVVGGLHDERDLPNIVS